MSAIDFVTALKPAPTCFANDKGKARAEVFGVLLPCTFDCY